MRPILAILLLAAAALIVPGCAKKAKPADPAGFVPMERMAHDEAIPFHKVWIKPDLDFQSHPKIQIADVNTDYLKETDWWKSWERGEEAYHRDVQHVADYAKSIFQRAFREDPNHRFEVAETPGPDTWVFELALIEVVPSKVFLNTLGYAPYAGTLFKLIRRTKGLSTVAFEARLKDGATGEVVALFADREAEKAALLVNVKDITWYGHAQSIIAEWAYQFVKVFEKKPGEVVKDSKPFHLKPW